MAAELTVTSCDVEYLLLELFKVQKSLSLDQLTLAQPSKHPASLVCRSVTRIWRRNWGNILVTTYCRKYLSVSHSQTCLPVLEDWISGSPHQGPLHNRLAATVENIAFVSRIFNILAFSCRSQESFMKKVTFSHFHCKSYGQSWVTGPSCYEK